MIEQTVDQTKCNSHLYFEASIISKVLFKQKTPRLKSHDISWYNKRFELWELNALDTSVFYDFQSCGRAKSHMMCSRCFSVWKKATLTCLAYFSGNLLRTFRFFVYSGSSFVLSLRKMCSISNKDNQTQKASKRR